MQNANKHLERVISLPLYGFYIGKKVLLDL